MALLGRVAKVGRVAAVRWNGYDSSFNPDSISDLWNLDPRNTTLGATLAATGAAPPVVTLSGTLTVPLGVRVEIQTTGVLGASTFRVSINNGTSYVASGVTTVATYLIPGTALTLNMPSGTYTNDNVYRATSATARDVSIFAQDAVQVTPANQPFFTAANANFNGNPTWDVPNATATAMATSAFGVSQTGAGTQTFVCMSTSTASQFVFLATPGGIRQLSFTGTGTTVSTFGTVGVTFPVHILKPAIVMWVWDGTSIVKGYVNGNLVGTLGAGLAAMPSFRLFNNLAGTNPLIGSVADVRISSRAITLTERRNVFNYFSLKHNIPIALAA